MLNTEKKKEKGVVVDRNAPPPSSFLTKVLPASSMKAEPFFIIESFIPEGPNPAPLCACHSVQLVSLMSEKQPTAQSLAASVSKTPPLPTAHRSKKSLAISNRPLIAAGRSKTPSINGSLIPPEAKYNRTPPLEKKGKKSNTSILGSFWKKTDSPHSPFREDKLPSSPLANQKRERTEWSNLSSPLTLSKTEKAEEIMAIFGSEELSDMHWFIFKCVLGNNKTKKKCFSYFFCTNTQISIKIDEAARQLFLKSMLNSLNPIRAEMLLGNSAEEAQKPYLAETLK
jgi:hypothetical protein